VTSLMCQLSILLINEVHGVPVSRPGDSGVPQFLYTCTWTSLAPQPSNHCIGHTAIPVVKCCLTRYVEITSSTQDRTASPPTPLLNVYISAMEPSAVITDNGTEFVNKLPLRSFCSAQHVTTHVYAPLPQWRGCREPQPHAFPASNRYCHHSK
jgi:hypothetical protein